jgi:hypothetical protein
MAQFFVKKGHSGITPTINRDKGLNSRITPIYHRHNRRDA